MKKLLYILTVLILLTATFISSTLLKSYYGNNETKPLSKSKVEEEIKEEPKTYTSKIWATGDIMYHMPLYKNNFNAEKSEYDFSNYYKKVEEYLNGADLVLGNFETTVNPNRPLSGHPMFNSPEESLKYLKASGFDILSTANNHCLDTGVEGVFTTIDAMDKAGIKHFGTYKERREPLIVESNNIKIGFLSYAEIFNGLESLVSQDKSYAISPLKEDLILNDISEMKNLGVDYIICYPHWGIEYSRVPSENQKHFEDFLLSNGVDAILGSHPHVVQGINEREINGEKKFTIYSMGNSISNQRELWLHRKGVESGVFVELNLEKTGDKTVLKSYNLFPTYVNRYRDERGWQSEVILYYDLIEGGKYRDLLTEKDKDFVDKSYNETMDILYNKEDKKEEAAA
ncbi:CapA family protein [Peptoniphilus catoniae]|uniref:CapA family protein n=1 Tax=Peptoniphilus catoniae TaxID=1660341 RepID=UPI0010FD8D13|nr:CapA family protein [Peptoniphilus catoniae]